MHGTVSDIRQDVRAVVSEVQRDVVSTHTMVSNIHRTMAKGQEGSGLLVSESHVLSITAWQLTVA